MDIKTPPRYYLANKPGGTKLVMTRGLTTKEAREKTKKHFFETINDPRRMKRIKASGIPEEFSSGVNYVTSQSFVVGLITKRRKENKIIARWIDTSGEERDMNYTRS